VLKTLGELKKEAIERLRVVNIQLKHANPDYRNLSIELATKHIAWLSNFPIPQNYLVRRPFISLITVKDIILVVIYDGTSWTATIPDDWWCYESAALTDLAANILNYLPVIE
jgi:hypothetical protein